MDEGLSVLKRLDIGHTSDVALARRTVRAIAVEVGFGECAGEEIALAAGELAANLITHAEGGVLTMSRLESEGRLGIQIDSSDRGPGIPNVGRAMTDGFSTAGGLGYGLGTVNRLMDEVAIAARGKGEGTRVQCRRWLPGESPNGHTCPVAFGVATRPHPGMALNGDAFVICRSASDALVAVIDGLGHGQYAHRAAQSARRYVETHHERPLEDLFQGTGHACRATRGVVMALVRLDWRRCTLSYAGIGNVEARLLGASEPIRLINRRGIVGAKAPRAMVQKVPWNNDGLLVIHTDGLASGWGKADLDSLEDETAEGLAAGLLRARARENDDATVAIARGRLP